MGKRKDEYVWSHMEKLANGVKCNYCSTSFKGRPSVSRLKSHLLGTPNQGIIDCKEVPSEVKRKLAELDKRRKTDAAGNLCFDLQTGDVAGGSGGMGEGGGEEIRVEHRESITEGTNSADLSQAREEDQPPVHPESLQLEERMTTQGIKLLTAAFVVDSLQGYVDQVWHWLVYGNVQGVALCGMGGIRKTALAKHINNKLLTIPNPFHHVYWVGVSQGYSIRKLQNAIAEAVDLSLPSFGDENICAARLWEALVEKKKSILILDDVWEFVDLERVGVPIGSDACKFVVTSRILSVCRQMGCQQIIKLNTLSKKQSWNLFLHTLGNATTLATEIEEVAISIVEQCKGLPLGIVTIAKCMRGAVDLREWRNTLEELKGLQPRPQIMEIFDSLKLSYSALRDPELQECFLYCALFPEDFEIPRWELIRYLVNDEIIKGPTSRKAQVDRVHALLNKLVNVGLLQGVQDEELKSCVKMHDLVRDMAIINSPKAMVEAGKQLRELPHASRWPTDLTRASFIANDIEDVPGADSPLCPALSSLLLSGNGRLRDIGNGFFTHMLGLRILDLSETGISVLPDSVSNLVNLTSLLLRSCEYLHHIPSLATLRKLQELDLSGCSKLKQVPAGLEFLSNLWYLDLTGTDIEVLPVGLFSHNLSNLEHLGLPYDSPLNERLACCGKLDYLSCHLQSPRDFIGMVTDDVQRLCPSNYSIRVGEVDEEDLFDSVGPQKVVRYYGCDIGEGGELFAAPSSGFDFAGIDSCHSLTSLDKFHCADDGGVGSGREVHFRDCDSLECLISPSYVPVPSNIVNHVVELTLRSLSHLRFLIHIAQPLLSHDVFSCLRVLGIVRCPGLQSLFTFELLANLRNLEEIYVEDCDGIEEIIAGRGIEGAVAMSSLLLGEASNSSSHCNNNESAEFITLPKLRVFRLLNLPQLKSICSRKMTCASLEEIGFWGCPRLERIPFCLVQLDNGRLSALPSLKTISILQHEQDWWNSVELDNKDVIGPLIHIEIFW